MNILDLLTTASATARACTALSLPEGAELAAVVDRIGASRTESQRASAALDTARETATAAERAYIAARSDAAFKRVEDARRVLARAELNMTAARDDAADAESKLHPTLARALRAEHAAHHRARIEGDAEKLARAYLAARSCMDALKPVGQSPAPGSARAPDADTALRARVASVALPPVRVLIDADLRGFAVTMAGIVSQVVTAIAPRLAAQDERGDAMRAAHARALELFKAALDASVSEAVPGVVDAYRPDFRAHSVDARDPRALSMHDGPNYAATNAANGVETPESYHHAHEHKPIPGAPVVI